jgi:hypothetical protein
MAFRGASVSSVKERLGSRLDLSSEGEADSKYPKTCRSSSSGMSCMVFGLIVLAAWAVDHPKRTK